MKLFKALVTALVFLLLGLSFFALVIWEWAGGYAAGSYGGVSFAAAPGLAWFFVALQLAMGAMFLSGAVAQVAAGGKDDDDDKDRATADAVRLPANLHGAIHTLVVAGMAGVLVALGLWALWDLGRMVLGVFGGGADPVDRIVVPLFLCAGIGVFAYLLYSMVARELFEYWKPRVRGALAYLRARP